MTIPSKAQAIALPGQAAMSAAVVSHVVGRAMTAPIAAVPPAVRGMDGTMLRMADRQPVHMLYSPKHRRQDYPDAAWNFLLVAARNMAAAFAAVHEHGHVIGDVNQGNVLVGKDAKVVFIDCDSFQVSANGQLHLCEVGVP